MASKKLMLFLSCLFVELAFNSSVFSQSGDPFKIRADVDLTTVEVTVLDKNGNPARNLKKENFQLYEDRKKQEILSIDEVTATSEASPPEVNPITGTIAHRGKTVLIVFADNYIKPDAIKTSRDSAEKFVREHMSPQDLFAVAKSDISLKILQNFTSDRKDVLEAIRRDVGVSLRYTDSFNWSRPSGWDRAFEVIIGSMAHIKGPKSILIYAQSPPTSSTSKASDNHDLDLLPDLRSSTRLPGTEIFSSHFADAIRFNLTYYAVDPGTPDAELDKIDKKMSNYYILGFRSNDNEHNGAIRKLEIKTPLKGLALKYRAGYQDRLAADVPATTEQETALLTALATPGIATQLPIVFRTAYFYDSPQTAKVLVASKVRLEKTLFRKKGAQVGVALKIMCIAYGEDGSTAARFKDTLAVSFEKEKEAEFRKKDLPYRNYLKLRPGKYRLKLAVSDEFGNLGSMERLLEIPILPDRVFAGSSLLLAEQASPLPELIRNLQSQMLDESNQLLFAGLQIEPSVDNRFPINSPLPIAFRLYNLSGPSERWNLIAKIRIVDEKGKEYSLGPIPLRNAMSVSSKAEAAVALSLPLKDAPPGKYRLVVEASEAASAQTAILETDLELFSPN